MNYQRLNKDEFLKECNLRINNSINDALIATAVAVFGYDDQNMQSGLDLLNIAKTAADKFDKEHGEVDAAFAQRDEKKTKAQATYIKLIQIGKVALKDIEEALSVLRIFKSKARTNSGWLKEKRSLYNNLLANPEWLSAYAKYGITQEMIEAGQAEVLAVEAQDEAIMREKGDAQNATMERDEAFEKLAEWVQDYETIARVALADKPQLLEKLGIIVK